MRKLAAILLFSIYLFGTTEASQLLKLPVLMQHYIEHKALDHSITLTAFLKMHYIGPDIRDNDYQRDMQLPFKTVNDCCVIAFNSFPPQRINIEFFQPQYHKQTHAVINTVFVPRFATHDIFQPPRQV
ncbi:hypothetical protein [Sediminibacterium ginsengisoli]|uniref:Uncharacterized protein n=1 Tax=Sediminibacterium ginsengisoli TaxID=413434 RepID=A0A1T4KYP3_9BACT|nr:hypothetical protein [Sediminibacterium ginsengisoli]SJZ47546.1 hypothetical protein SAMN04488132_102196 [Sediminibacterium ginsengisoli]